LRPVGTRRTATGTATASGQPWFLEERWWSSIFLVEDMERRQTNVGDFLLTKKGSGFRLFVSTVDGKMWMLVITSEGLTSRNIPTPCGGDAWNAMPATVSARVLVAKNLLRMQPDFVLNRTLSRCQLAAFHRHDREAGGNGTLPCSARAMKRGCASRANEPRTIFKVAANMM
jgi:hypothetical protein